MLTMSSEELQPAEMHVNNVFTRASASRDACQHCLQKSFSQQRCMSTMSSQELQPAAKALVDSFQTDLDNYSFIDELCHCAMFADISKDEEP